MTTTPAPRPGTSVAALTAPLLSGVLGLGAVALVHARDPHVGGSYGLCPFLSVTGLPCPGCGGLRAVNDLTHGQLVAAVSSNALAVALVLVIAALWIVWIARRFGGDRKARLVAVTARGAWAVGGVVVVFGVLRLTPWGAWLAP